jgi:hypothetical protein
MQQNLMSLSKDRLLACHGDARYALMKGRLIVDAMIDRWGI